MLPDNTEKGKNSVPSGKTLTPLDALPWPTDSTQKNDLNSLIKIYPPLSKPVLRCWKKLPHDILNTDTLYISVDSEYTNKYIYPPEGIVMTPITEEEKKRQKVEPADIPISTQLLVCYPRAQTLHQVFLRHDHRLSSHDILWEACQLVDSHLWSQLYRKPLNVVFIGHWLTAEVGLFADRKRFLAYQQKEHIIALSGGLMTTKTLSLPVKLDDCDHYGTVNLTIRDTSLLLNKGSALKVLGKEMGIPKLKISQYWIEHMDEFYTKHPKRFIAYAMRDTAISFLWLIQYTLFERQSLHLTGICRPTLGATTVAGYQEHLKSTGRDIYTMFGWYKPLKAERRYMQGNTKWSPTTMRRKTESNAANCYVGGCNMTNHLGPVEGCVIDPDMTSAYLRAQAMLKVINFNKVHYFNKEELNNRPPVINILENPYFFALIRFQFPQGTLFPCLPIYTPHGLIFPMQHVHSPQGDSYIWASAPEIIEAQAMEAEIEYDSAFLLEVHNEYYFREYLIALAAERAKYPPGSVQNTTAKIAALTLYGKTGQGVNERARNEELFNRDNQESQESHKMPRCAVSLPHVAAITTSIVRAGLNAFLRATTLHNGLVLGGITDGWMARFNPDIDIPATVNTLTATASSSQAIQLLQQGGEAIQLKKPLITVEKIGVRAWTVATRFNTLWHANGTQHEVRTGYEKDVKKPSYVRSEVLMEWQQNMRNGHAVPWYRRNDLRSLKDVHEGRGKDITSYTGEFPLNLTPDWKRHFLPDGSSIPFHDMQEYWQYRNVVDTLTVHAWPEAVETAVHAPRVLRTTTEKAVLRKLLHQIAHEMPGYRTHRTHREIIACLQRHFPHSTYAHNIFSRLKGERMINTNFTLPERYCALVHELGLH